MGSLMWDVSSLRAKVRELLEKHSADVGMTLGQLTSSQLTTARSSTTKETLRKFLDENGISSSHTLPARTSARQVSTGTSASLAEKNRHKMLSDSLSDYYRLRAQESQSRTQSVKSEQQSALLLSTYNLISSGIVPASVLDCGSQDYHSCSQPSTSSHDW